jgi:NADH:ubiquinone oxidoreductase subunit 6 (subunit J)
MSAELVLFILVAAIAIFSAALMLVSRNAVHASLFLVTNLLCVAFFYLMLNAPFLAMVQVTVYAGAIMVLFMFVIMILGSERLAGGSARYAWISTSAVGLGTVFLIIAFLVIMQGNVQLLKPVAIAPAVRFVHAVAGAPAVDVFINDQQVAEAVAFGEASAFADARAGDFNLLVFANCHSGEHSGEDHAAATEPCPNPLTTGATPLLAAPLGLLADTDNTYVIGGTVNALRLISTPVDLSVVGDDRTFRLTVINAYPDGGPVSVFQVNPSNPAQPTVVVPALAYGDFVANLPFTQGDFTFQFKQQETVLVTIQNMRVKGKLHELLILAPEQAPSAIEGEVNFRPSLLHPLPAMRLNEAFGSPQAIGLELLTKYLLPFEMIAVLLLATMVGAIILTREEVIKRVRRRVVVSPVVKRINQGLAANTPRPLDAASASDTAAEPASD